MLLMKAKSWDFRSMGEAKTTLYAAKWSPRERARDAVLSRRRLTQREGARGEYRATNSGRHVAARRTDDPANCVRHQTAPIKGEQNVMTAHSRVQNTVHSLTPSAG